MALPRLRPCLLVLLLSCAYLAASTFVLSSGDSWGGDSWGSPKKGITITIEKSVKKGGDHWSNPWANPWPNPWPSNPWGSSWSSGSGGKFTKEIVISKSGGGSSWNPSWPPAGWSGKSSWPPAGWSSKPAQSWPPSGWSGKSSWPPIGWPPKSWPSSGWKGGKEISISIGSGGWDSWASGSSESSSWSNPWDSWDPWKSSRVKIKPEASEVHSGDALIREHRNSNLGINGYVQFMQFNDYVEVNGIICNLPAGKHAFHIHTFGEISNGCQDTLGDYNPYHVEHGGPMHKIRHLGDLGNIEANSTGIARFKFVDKQLRVHDRIRGIIGRSIVIHEFEDDFGKGREKESKRNGNAGGRLACGVIGISQTANYGTLPFTCNRKN